MGSQSFTEGRRASIDGVAMDRESQPKQSKERINVGDQSSMRSQNSNRVRRTSMQYGGLMWGVQQRDVLCKMRKEFTWVRGWPGMRH